MNGLFENSYTFTLTHILTITKYCTTTSTELLFSRGQIICSIFVDAYPTLIGVCIYNNCFPIRTFTFIGIINLKINIIILNFLSSTTCNRFKFYTTAGLCRSFRRLFCCKILCLYVSDLTLINNLAPTLCSCSSSLYSLTFFQCAECFALC